MGHTLVTGFSQQSLDKLDSLVNATGEPQPNTIPFGRHCYREAANQTLDYHVTLFHWGKNEDSVYLERLKNYCFPGKCRVTVEGADIMYAEEGSMLLYLLVKPAEGFDKLTKSLQNALHCDTSSFLHITLAVSKNHSDILRLYHYVFRWQFPFGLTVSSLDLYHIWNPVRIINGV